MRSVCITCDAESERYINTRDHLASNGINVEPFIGFNNRLAGLKTDHTYDVDHPGTGYRIAGPVIGIGVSHWMLWRAMSLWDDEEILLFEDDARFAPGGAERLAKVWDDLPDDWDICYTGSCCCESRPRHQIKNDIWFVRYPLCTHSYAIKKRVAFVMQDLHDKMWAPVDISMFIDAYQRSGLKIYTVLPRIFEQNATIIQP